MSATGCLQVNQMESNAHRMLTRRHLCGRRHVCARRHLCAAHLAISAHRARRHASTLRTVIYVRDVIYARNDCLMRVREFCTGTTDISRRRHLCVSMPSMAFVMSCMRGLPNRRGAETGQRACGEQAPTGPKSSMSWYSWVDSNHRPPDPQFRPDSISKSLSEHAFPMAAN
jgi:hypothetical protein